MALTLALVEFGSLFSAVCAVIVLSVAPPILDWTDVVWLGSQAGVVALCCIVSFYYNDFYDLRIVRNFPDVAARLLQSVGVTFILLAGFYSMFPDTRLAREPLLSAVLVILGLLLPIRAASYAFMRSRPFLERVLILGNSPLARKLTDEIAACPNAGYTVVGVLEDGAAAADSPAGIPRLGRLDRLEEIIGLTRPDRLVVALSERRGRLPVRPLLDARMKGIAVQDGVELYEHLTGKLAIESLTPSYLIFSSDFKKSRLELAGGRLVSLAAAVVGLLLTAPLLAVISVAIKLDSRGPVFFLHDRVGRYGKTFRLIKFRTMHPRVEGTSEWVRDNNHRVTRVGHWLRKFRLDELPQFVNILRGELNLVGPRPHPVSNFELFLKEIPYYSLRSLVHPGVTGWAQIRYGYANDLVEETEKMRYDLYFIKHLSLGLDLRILIDTVKTVLFGRGATQAGAYQTITQGASTP